MDIYIIPSKAFWKYGYKIKGEDGSERGIIKGQLMEIDKTVTVTGVAGNSRIAVHVGGLRTKLDISGGGKHIVIVRKPSLFNTRLDITGTSWTVKGVIENYDYKIVDGKKLIARVSDQGFFGRKILVQIENPSDEVCVTAIVAALIACKDSRDQANNMNMI